MQQVAVLDDLVALVSRTPPKGRFGPVRRAGLSVVHDVMRSTALAAIVTAGAFILGPPLHRLARHEAASVLQARPVLVRTGASQVVVEHRLRGRLGDYYVFVDEHGPLLMARSHVAELRAPAPALQGLARRSPTGASPPVKGMQS